MPALESRRVRTQPLTVTGAAFGAWPARMARTLSSLLAMARVASGRTTWCGGARRRRRLRVQGQRPQQRRRRLEEEHQHGAAPGRDRRVLATLGADDEIAGGAFAFAVEQRAFEHERLLEILVFVRRNAGTRLELRQNGQHAGRRVVIDHLELLPWSILDPRQRLGLDEARRQCAERSSFSHGFLLRFTVSLCAGEEA